MRYIHVCARNIHEQKRQFYILEKPNLENPEVSCHAIEIAILLHAMLFEV